MVADCGATCAKYILCLCNFIFFVTGSAVLCVGIWLALDTTSFIHLTRFNSFHAGSEELTEPTVIEQGAYILIAAGAFIFLVSFLGYCGAIKESRVFLTAYGLFLIIIACLQIAAIVLASMHKEVAKTHTQDFFRHTIRKYYTTSDRKDAVTLSWDFVMAELGCCGVENYLDFQDAREFQKYAHEKGDGQMIPEACCILDEEKDIALFKPADENCIYAPSTDNSNMEKGCYNMVYGHVVGNLNVVIGAAVGVIAVQVFGIIFAFCLCKAVGNERDYHYKY